MGAVSPAASWGRRTRPRGRWPRATGRPTGRAPSTKCASATRAAPSPERRRACRRRLRRASACQASRTAPVSQHAADVHSSAVYGQIGSPANTATDFGTSVTQFADTFGWQKGRHAIKFGGDLRWERLNVIQPPSPTGVFAFTNLFTDQPTRRRTPARRWRASCSDRSRPSRSTCSRTRSGTGRTSRSTSSRTTGASTIASRSTPACATR